jgi:hypothetical protein
MLRYRITIEINDNGDMLVISEQGKQWDFHSGAVYSMFLNWLMKLERDRIQVELHQHKLESEE